MVRQKELVARIKRSKARPALSRSLTIRLPNELYDKLDAYAGKLAAELPGIDLTLSDVVRNLLEQSLMERERAARREEREAQEVEEIRQQLNIDPSGR